MKIGTPSLLIPQNILPPDAENLAVYDGDNKICDIPLGHLSPPDMGEKLYSVGLLSDSHVTSSSNTNDSMTDFPRALQYYNDVVDFVCMCGDGVDTGTDSNFELYKSCIDTNLPDIPIYSITGNHETYTGGDPYRHEEDVLKSLMRTYAKVPLYYTVSSNPTTELNADGVIADGGNIYNASVGDDVYIMLGIARDYVHFGAGTGTLQWLYETLETNRNKRCFIFEHIRPDDASGNGDNLHWTDLWGEDTNIVKVFTSLLKHYKNVIFFHGHSHFTLELQTRTNLANIDEIYGRYSVHVPSLTYPRGYPLTDEGRPTNLVNKSEGYVMDVYADHVILRGRDFVASNWITVAQYCLPMALQTVQAGTYTDDTGLIVT